MNTILNANEALCLHCQSVGCKRGAKATGKKLMCAKCGSGFLIDKKTKQPFEPKYAEPGDALFNGKREKVASRRSAYS